MKKTENRAKAKSRTVEIAPLDASEFLDNEEVTAEYLAAALEDPNPDTYLRAMANVAKSRGISSRKDVATGEEGAA